MIFDVRRLFFIMVAACVSTAFASNDDETLWKRQTDHYLFKGEPIPEINWTSPDTYNFTWGLAGVDNFENLEFGHNLITTLGSIVMIILVYRFYLAHLHHIRLIASVTSPASANYFAQPLSPVLRFLQKHIAIAPLFKTRYNEPLYSGAGKFYLGVLPSRLNAIFLFGYILSNVIYCTYMLPWNGKVGPDNKLHAPTKASLIAEFRGRTGVMAVVNLVPLFLCMMRNNYIGKITGISFSTWNLYHRWAGRIVVIESFCHTIAWMINQVDYNGWSGIGPAIREKRFLQMGLLGVISLFLILVTSVAPLRHAHYQVFLGIHQVCIAMFLSGAWFHCYIDQLPHQIYVNVAIGLWIGERLHRLFNILRKNKIFGKSWNITTAELQLTLSGEDAVRVSVRMPGVWNYKPGQHAYIYMPRLSWTQSHPFSIAWSTTTMESIPLAESTLAVVDSGSSEKIDPSRYYVEEPRTTIHFVIQRHAGFTNRLFLQASENARQYFLDPERAEHKPPRFLAMVEGPYSSESYSFDSFPTVLFVAGGAGITHPLGFIRHLLIASAENLVATRRIKLVWIIRDKNNCGWISDWLEELWHLDADREILEVEIYVTRPDKMKDRRTRMGGRKIKWMVGRPQHEIIISGMLAPHKKQGPVGALAVNACGSGSVCDGVRAAVREKLHEARIEYSEESFSWS